MIDNAKIAREEKLGLCQDTGLAVFAVELGEDVRCEKADGLGSLREAITEGTRLGYAEGYLRKSVVEDPIRRKNTGTNTPAYIHWELVGGGVGGNFEYSAWLAKKALLRRPLGTHNPDPFYADMEQRLLERINKLGIGPQGMGGRITALAVPVESFPCHIASMPAAVNIECQ